MRRLDILRHSLGLNQYGEGKQYRNHFVTGPGSDDFDDCRALVAEGMMVERAAGELSGGDPIFQVTIKGREYVKAIKEERP